MRENLERTTTFIVLAEDNGKFKKPYTIRNDHGGLTGFGGLTLKTMKILGLDLDLDGHVDDDDLRLVNKEVVEAAFKKSFWDKFGGDKIKGGVDLILGDVAWNSGPGKAKQFIREGFATDVERLTERRISFYEYRVKVDPSQERFIKGWKNRANNALREADKCVKEA